MQEISIDVKTSAGLRVPLKPHLMFKVELMEF